MGVMWETEPLTKTRVETIQINVGNRCNQACTHCHTGASPRGSRNMDARTARLVLDKLIAMDIGEVEFTGGTPEMNPNFKTFVDELTAAGKSVSVRTSLTVLDIQEYSFYAELYRRSGVKIIASLPSCFDDLTDRQRGKGVFGSSINALRKLNGLGYGGDGLELDLVYNPSGDFLPPSEHELERQYRKLLGDMYGITFSRLIAITNSPIGRFRKKLAAEGRLDGYVKLLSEHFNPETLAGIMCRRLISVDYQGHVYDCDFNLALGTRVKGYEDTRFWDIDFEDFFPEITCAEHCYACTVNMGSSCHGALIKEVPAFDVRAEVRKYYGSELTGTLDLKTGACCTADSMPTHVREALPFIAEEIKEKYYGCGSPIPLVLNGLKVLDLGCGTGRDCYILSKLVGEEGHVYGIDMTQAQIDVARKYVDEQTRRFGYARPNVSFMHDYIENFGGYVGAGTLDLVTSNCVVNLVEDKESLIRQVYRALRPGGEFFFSDVYADRRLPGELRTDPVLYGECMGGALYWKDFERMSRRAGFTDPRVVSKRTIDARDEEIKKKVGNITFYSITYRLWKLEGLEDACEDFGHFAVYKGGIPESPFSFELDGSHVFQRGLPEKVCGNTALMLSGTRLAWFFDVYGDFSEHFGLFKDCGTPKDDQKEGGGGCSC